MVALWKKFSIAFSPLVLISLGQYFPRFSQLIGLVLVENPQCDVSFSQCYQIISSMPRCYWFDNLLGRVQCCWCLLGDNIPSMDSSSIFLTFRICLQIKSFVCMILEMMFEHQQLFIATDIVACHPLLPNYLALLCV